MDNIADPIGQLFLRLLLMVVVPMVFSALIVGVAGVGDIRELGRIGLETFLYARVITAISVAIGITMVSTIHPGERLDPATAAGLQAEYGVDAVSARRLDLEEIPGAFFGLRENPWLRSRLAGSNRNRDGRFLAERAE